MSRKKNLPAKDALLISARKLIIEKGYSATSVEEICSCAGYSKGTLFHYFDDKQDLGKTLLLAQEQQLAALFDNAHFSQLADPLDRIGEYIDFIASIFQKPVEDSCLVGILTEELSSTHPEIRKLCKGIFKKWATAMADMLKSAEKKYPLREEVDFYILAEHFIAIFEGAVILSRAKNSVDPVSESLKLYKQFVFSIFETKQMLGAASE